MNKRFCTLGLSVLLIFMLSTCICLAAETPTPTAPQQDEDGTYLIGTAAELIWLDQQSTSVSLARAKELDNINVRLTADIDLAGYNWIPICARNSNSSGYIRATARTYYSGEGFSGTFDGNGHKISNFTIDIVNKYGSEARFDSVGLFGYLHTGTVKNLGIEGDITVMDNIYSTIGEWQNVGAVAGFATSSNISGCYADVDIKTGIVRNNGIPVYKNTCTMNTGGIVGAITLTTTIDNCYSRGSITSDTNGSISAGGVVGQSRLSTHTDDGAYDNKIQRCWSDIDIVVDSTSLKYESYLGGIVGEVDGLSENSIPDISYCFALNSSLNGGWVGIGAEEDLVFAGRVVGNGDTFASNGRYNYALSSMQILGAVPSMGDPDESNYRTSWGRDITETQAHIGTSYTNVTWNNDSEVWLFDGADYPSLAWQQSTPQTGGDIISIAPAHGEGTVAGTISCTEPANGWKTGENNTFSVACNQAACVVILQSADGSLQKLTASPNGAAYDYTVNLKDGDKINVYIRGDVNNDGNIDAADVSYLADELTGEDALSASLAIVADVNNDDEVNLMDVLNILAAGKAKANLAW